jgi:hypothetical protein
MSWLNPDRGTVLIATLGVVGPDGAGQSAAIDVIGLGIGGIRERDVLDATGVPASFADKLPELDGMSVQQVVLSIAYPNGAFEVTAPIAFNGDVGNVAWAPVLLALADPAPVGDPMVDPAFVVARRHAPNPSVTP